MSFYGNVTYYLSNAFNKMIYRNANNACTHDNIEVFDGVSGPDAISYEYTLSPRSRNDDVILETGNKWIVFADPEGTQGNNQIRIFHTLSDAANGQSGVAQPTIVSRDAIDNQITPLDFKSVITLPTIAFDQAGHISGVTSSQYQLADPPGAQDIAQFRTELDDHISTFTNYRNQTDASIGTLSNKISVWDMQDSGDPYNNYKEASGIGTALHEALTVLGLRKAHANAYDNKTGYETISQQVAATDANCLIGKTNMAYSSAQNASSISASNRLGIRALLDMLVASHAIEASDRENLKAQYFIVSGDVTPEP